MLQESKRSRNAILNIFCALILQLITAVNGLILPRLIIPTYGSDVNGLIGSIMQFIAYISLLEAGVGGVINATLYKPLAQNDISRVSEIFCTAKLFYQKIGRINIVYIIFLSIVYSSVVNTGFGREYVVALILILSVETFLEYYFSLPYIILMTADQKVRITYLVTSATIVVNIITTYYLVNIGASIHLVKLASCLVFAAKPIFYTYYVRRKYYLENTYVYDLSAIKQRWNGIAHNMASFIHFNTDIVIITLFIGTKAVSIYTVYYMVVFGIQRIITSISTGSAASIGNLIINADQVAINRAVDTFEFLQGGLTTILFTITALMLMPFIRLYTVSMTDANYIQPLFGYLLILSEAIYCIGLIYTTIALNANRYKETQIGAWAECITNVVISLVLVSILGMVGVVIGTLVAMLVRNCYDVIYLSRHVIKRTVKKFIKLILVNCAVSLGAITTCRLILSYDILTWREWILNGMLTFSITLVIAGLFYLIFYREVLVRLIRSSKQLLLRKWGV